MEYTLDSDTLISEVPHHPFMDGDIITYTTSRVKDMLRPDAPKETLRCRVTADGEGMSGPCNACILSGYDCINVRCNGPRSFPFHLTGEDGQITETVADASAE